MGSWWNHLLMRRGQLFTVEGFTPGLLCESLWKITRVAYIRVSRTRRALPILRSREETHEQIFHEMSDDVSCRQGQQICPLMQSICTTCPLAGAQKGPRGIAWGVRERSGPHIRV